jgi:hypothetical protein
LIVVDQTGTGDSPVYPFGVGQGNRAQGHPSPNLSRRYPSK